MKLPTKSDEAVISQSEQPVRVVLIHEHPIVREGLRLLLQHHGNITVIGEGSECDDAKELLSNEFADIVLLDVDLRDPKCMVAVSTLMEAAPETRIIILTGVQEPELHRQAIQHGVWGVFLKNQSCDVLIKAIQKVMEGEVWLDRSMIATVIADFRRGASDDKDEKIKIASLTSREREIVALVCEGLRNQEIADRLFIGEKTVRNHLASIFSKLDVAHRLELSVYAQKHGLVARNR